MKYNISYIACPYLRSNVFDEQKGSTSRALSMNVISVTSVKASPVVNGSLNLKACL